MTSRWLAVLCAGLLCAAPVAAQGLLVPTDSSLPPLHLVNHNVAVEIDDQVATTKVTQIYKNDSGRDLEATYVFPVPRGANVNKFSMWVNGKEEKAELVEADKARQVYTDIVRRAQDPGLLEYVGNNLLKVRVYPVPARGEQKLAFSYTAVVPQDNGLCEYVYPLKTTEKSTASKAKFLFQAKVKSKGVLSNVYCPSHKIVPTQPNDHESEFTIENNQSPLDKDLTIYYGLGGKDVGLTAVPFRADADVDGHVMLLISPRAELGRSQQTPRDFVFVLDTSGSMKGPKMEQGKKALKFCLSSLSSQDRFAVLNFATTVNSFADGLTDAGGTQVEKARKWVDGLESTGGTAIDAALTAALKFRPEDSGRTFTVVFFTDGQPTVGETNPDTIVKNVMAKKTRNTRIFTFGVGDDVNAVMLDKLADETRAVSTYVRPEEDIEVKVSGLYGKISHPVLTDLKLKATGGAQLSEMYPTQLPDLFHGGQLVVLARYSGSGSVALTLSGRVGGDEQEIVHEIALPKKTDGDKAFVEGLWARRKVGYLLDQIRGNGENKELVEEVVKLAKKHGITTPYTSYLLVPDGTPSTPPVVRGVPRPAEPVRETPGRINYAPNFVPPAMQFGQPAATAPLQSHGYHFNGPTAEMVPQSTASASTVRPAAVPAPMAAPSPVLYADDALTRTPPTAQTGKEGVDLALQLRTLKEQEQTTATTRQAAGRTFAQLNGVWTDLGLSGEAKTVKVKVMSDAYFLLLKKHPELKDVFQLGNRVVWVTPSGTVLVVGDDGKEKMTDEEVTQLFVAKK